MAISHGVAVYLIFGGTGFIGKNLCRRLYQDGREAITVSRQPDTDFLANYAPTIDALTLEEFWNSPEFYLSRFPTVIYLASTSIPAANANAPWKDLHDAVTPAFKVASQVASLEVGRFVYISSGGAVYGHTSGVEVDENFEKKPISPYGFAKLMTEEALKFLSRSRGLEFSILRPSNPTGNWQTNKAQGVVGALIRAAQAGGTFTMFGDGSTTRDYIAVEELVDAILRASDPKSPSNDIWNIGSGKGYSIKDVHNIVCKISNTKIPVTSMPKRLSDVDHLVLNIKKAKRDLNWHPKTELETQIKNILLYQ